MPGADIWLWIATVGGVLALFAIDLFVAGRNGAMGFRASAAWTVLFTTIAVGFGVGFGVAAGWDAGTEYFAGYIVERSLSVDNLFVFVIIMSTFAVPVELQHHVLTIGIVMALALRAVFIALGATLIASFSFMFLLFGLLLVYTAAQLFRHRNEDPSIEDNKIIALAQRRLPFSTAYEGSRLTTRIDGRRLFTPLALVLIAIGTTDVLFALDSIPAVFGVTEDGYIVFVANAFALLGLPALYELVSGLLSRLVYLSTGLAIVLAFIGAKLVLHYLHEVIAGIPEISTGLSLVVIAVVLTVTIAASLRKSRLDPDAVAHAGSLRGHPNTSASEKNPLGR